MNRLDHLVIAAETLEQGVDYLRSTLGVDIPKGGIHRTMGTHNHVMQLGKESYLEVIAINPDGIVPDHPRWFNLDEQLMRESLQRQPRLITWVVNTPDIQATHR
ncbi:MAG: VOC family protein, partial [Gammaproteobacteria bacterium]